jgi:hypothetical protein
LWFSLGNVDLSLLHEVKQMLISGLHSAQKSLALDNMGLDREEDQLTLEDLAKTLARSVEKAHAPAGSPRSYFTSARAQADLPRTITFQYSRHSSYAELCDLLGILKPKDIYPCTVDKEGWHTGVLISL